MAMKVFDPSSVGKLRLLNFALSFALVGMIALIVSHAALPAGYVGYFEQGVVDKVNAARSKAGLGKLQHIECLNTVAESWSRKMASINTMIHSTYYPSKTSPSQPFPKEITETCGGSWSIVGENVAAGQSTADSVFNTWWASPTHKENIMRSSFTKTGVGAYRDANGKMWWTQVFARCSSCTTAWSRAATVGIAMPAYGVSMYFNTVPGVTPANMTTYDYQSQVMDNEDVFFIKRKAAPSGMVEVNRLTAASGHTAWTGVRSTVIPLTDIAKYGAEIQMANNGDLYFIRKQNTVSGNIEVALLTATSGYKTWAWDKPTIIPVGDLAKYSARLQVGYSGNLYLFKRSGTSNGLVQIDRLGLASGYKTWDYQKSTSISTADAAKFNYQIRAMQNGDFFFIKLQNTASGRIELGRLMSDMKTWRFQAYGPYPLTSIATDQLQFTPLQDGDLSTVLVKTQLNVVKIQKTGI